jgi:hypothetical protein
MKYRIYSDTPASDDFNACFPGGGGISVECTCGRRHVAIDSRDIREDEVERYLEWAKEDPEGIILEYNIDYVHYAMIQGNAFVDDCPCNGMAPYEKLFWNYRENMRQYLTMVKMRKIAEAEDIKPWEPF